MRYRWELALIGVTAIWGWTFTIVRDAVERIPPFLYLSLRFALAAAVLALIGAFSGITRLELRAGAVIGVALFAGYAFQTTGLQYTTPSNAGFITGLLVVFTPLLAALVLHALPAPSTLLGVALATAGLMLLAMPEGLHLERGDGLVLLCAVSFAAHILLIGRLAPGLSALRLAGVQVTVAGVLCAGWTAVAERQTLAGADATVWVAVAVTGVLATAVAFLVQTRAQQTIPPTRTAVILTAEPVFAGIFGYLLAGDRLGGRGYAGGALIVLGILAVALLSPERERV